MFEVKKELLDSHEALLEVVFEESTVDEAKRRAARKISREINIPGFRKGKAPYAKVLQYVGEPNVLQEAAETLVDEAYSQILEKSEVSPYGPGEFVDMEASPLTFRIRVPLEPDVELGDYQSIREAWEGPSVSDEEIQQVLEQIREEHAILEPVDRPAAMGDQVMVDVKAVAGDDVIVDEKAIEVVLSEERPFLSTEFVEALIGMNIDESREIKLALPDTVEEPSLRGVEADFALKVAHVHERVLPDLDDALASTVGSFETFAELEHDIRDRILAQKQERVESAYRSKLVTQLVEQATIAYPPKLVDDTLDDIVEEAKQRVESQREMSFEDALRLDGLTLEQFREQMKPQAERRVEQSLTLSKFAEVADVEASDDEIVQEYGDLLGRMGLSEQLPDRQIDLDSPLGRNLRSNVVGRKVMDVLAAIGRGESLDTVAEVEETSAEPVTDSEDVPEGGASVTPAVPETADADDTPAVE